MIDLKNMNKIFESIVQGRRYTDDQQEHEKMLSIFTQTEIEENTR